MQQTNWNSFAKVIVTAADKKEELHLETQAELIVGPGNVDDGCTGEDPITDDTQSDFSI